MNGIQRSLLTGSARELKKERMIVSMKLTKLISVDSLIPKNMAKCFNNRNHRGHEVVAIRWNTYSKISFSNPSNTSSSMNAQKMSTKIRAMKQKWYTNANMTHPTHLICGIMADCTILNLTFCNWAMLYREMILFLAWTGVYEGRLVNWISILRWGSKQNDSKGIPTFPPPSSV